ncbi:PIG-L family deacetylase [Winogradskyella maritima]|uniref:PIG-L family deacetylase n=1 Tax=Winogradskyella maritima TaxID=1517766 RepID=A0ABV8AGH4_9FLAO|nr:PIG-L family deacetylase [Winogradskyella maritima]
MLNYRLCIILFICSLFTLNAQQPKKLNSSEIYEAVQKLNVLASVLYVAAHPDDENTRLIAYMANQEKARTAYLSLTRGDGGQNLIGPELRELLGLMRTQELLRARSIDGGEQLFTRANDFGFSKHPDETLSIWNKDKVLSDVVWAIRTFKPDVIINRFDHRTPGTTHGHHTSSAMLSIEAFDIASDASKYSDQLQYTDTWQPKRIYFNTTPWFYRNREDFDKANAENRVTFDIGVYYPLKGMSNNEVASLASSQHLCQGFGRLSQRGSQNEYLEFLKGDESQSESNIFEGIDTSWNRIAGGQAIANILKPIENDFNFANPASHLPELLQAYSLLQNAKDKHWKAIKTKELKTIIKAVAGLYLEASATMPTATQNDKVDIKIEALNRSNADIKLIAYSITSLDGTIEKNIEMAPNDRINIDEAITLSENLDYTSPYWLNEKGSLGMYKVNDRKLIGKPETPRAVNMTFYLTINGTPIDFTKPVVHRYSKPDKGELYRPFEIIPPVTASIKDKVFIFENDKEKQIEVTVKAGKNDIAGTVSLKYPNDWTVYPESQNVSIANKSDIQTFTFTVVPPKNQSEGVISPKVTLDGKTYSKELVEIDYSHIPFQTVLLPAESKVVRLDIQTGNHKIAYIEGAGDVVPESLRQIGYNVTVLQPEQITPENLVQFDAVVLGIRAYNTVEELKFKNKYLLEFVENGGNMVVQYNTRHRVLVPDFAPYELKLSRDRVTDENAPIEILDSNHPILNYPNKITEKDFEGWVQERGLYFPDEWSDEYTPLLASNDKGETKKEGALVVAKYGKGNYIYTGLSFFREFPAGVSGAYRLFANLVSAGKNTIKTDQKLND